ncbi:MAG: 50S ribosomal protein L10, partial [Candidatus Blackburnbacteria bacterium]|nr:50S ribosomal protein L10 [Candidatus Blackburnbacteria bacterium]
AVVNYQGIPVKEQEKLRRDLGKVGGHFQVVKNTLLKRAFENAKVKDGLPRDEVLRGPTAVVLANDDELAPLQILGKLIRATAFPQLKFGIFGGDILDSEKLQRLAQLPAKNVLFGQLVGTMASPMYGLVGTLQGNLQKLVYTLKTTVMRNGGDE